MNNETRTVKRLTWDVWAFDNWELEECQPTCSQGNHYDSDMVEKGFKANEPYIDHLEAENKKLKDVLTLIYGMSKNPDEKTGLLNVYTASRSVLKGLEK